MEAGAARSSMFLASVEADAIAARIAAIEARTGVQVVTAFVGRAARYPEARWKAFALAVSVAALIVAILGFLRPGWNGAEAPLGVIVAILAAGITNAILATYVGAYERLFVRHNRAAAEVRQYAEGLFLARGLFATPGRTAVLIVVSLFERVVIVHADRGFAGRVPASEWDDVVAPMTPALRAGEHGGAMQAGLTALESLLVRKDFVATGAEANALPDSPLQERGA
jgi:putative membrane protein